MRRFGAATLDGCWVACGRFDSFYEFGLSAWDVAASSVIAREAGCKVINFDVPGSESFSVFAKSFLFSSASLYPAMFEVSSRWLSGARKTDA